MARLCGGLAIEDLWRRYFAVSANLSRAEVVVHDRGPLAQAVLASNTAPGLFPPQVRDGDLLVDGGLLNNVPVDVMQRKLDGGRVVAVDVNPKEELLANTPYAGGLSGWRVAASRLPFAEPMHVPNIIDVMARTVRLGGLAKRNETLQAGAQLYLLPPLGEFAIMGYDSTEAIVECGYRYTKTRLAENREWIARTFGPSAGG